MSLKISRAGPRWPLILAAAGTLAMASVKPAFAVDPRFLDAGGVSLPPIGWVQFCQQNEADCAIDGSAQDMIMRGSAAWKAMRRINDDVNRRIAPITDEEHWGMVERWSYPTDGQGDCEDYVLEKRRLLIEAGAPVGALMIGVVLDKEGLGHAVLIVRTSVGDLVLDNQENRILSWRHTGYTFLKRQDFTSPGRWVSLNKRRAADAEVMAATP
jgi:predicted transglutaminase-like cysteine proteinase